MIERRKMMDIGTLVGKVNAVWNETENQGSYSGAFMMTAGYRLPHVRAVHASMHLTKALGKVVAAIEPLDHDVNATVDGALLDKALADVLICAARVAGLFERDLATVVSARVDEIAERSAPADHAKP